MFSADEDKNELQIFYDKLEKKAGVFRCAVHDISSSFDFSSEILGVHLLSVHVSAP